MLVVFPRLSLLHRNPNLPIPPSIRALSSLLPQMAAAATATAKVVAEYAKSGRSSCKNCGKSIASGSLRLGLSTKDPRGFDLVKWHHLHCFPTKSRSISAAEEIKGFSSLKGSDQEALRSLQASASANDDDGCVKENLKRDDAELEDLERNAKKTKFQNREDGGSKEFEEKSFEILKSSEEGERTGLEIVFSVADIKNTYKDASLAPNWKSFRTIIFNEREDGLCDSEKIAAFDFDGCLANTSVKRVGPDAWSLMYPSIPGKLQELYNSGYKLVIFTNESNIERWKKKRQQAVDSKVGRLNGFLKHVEVPMQVFIACGLGKNKDQIDDPFRKPKPGMWRLMAEHFNSGFAIDMDQSFYVGDAAGRVNDHSDADISFAQAIGLKFHLPEDFFGA